MNETRKLNLDLFEFHYYKLGDSFENKKPLTINEINLFKNYKELVLLFKKQPHSFEIVAKNTEFIVCISRKDYMYYLPEEIVIPAVKQFLDILLEACENEQKEQEYFYC